LIRKLGMRLVAGQDPSGAWTYGCPLLSAAVQDRLISVLTGAGAGQALDPATLKEGNVLPPALLNRMGALRDVAGVKPESFRGWEGDNSNSQFAMLGLWVAGRPRYGVPVERTVALAAARYHNTQMMDGSWPYSRSNLIASPMRLPTMGCAGLVGLAVAHGVAVDAGGSNQTDPAVTRALALIGKKVTELEKARQQQTKAGRGGNAKPGMVDLYFMWSVERVAVLFNLEKFGDADWYAWGSKVLIPNQEKNGSWQGGKYPGSNPIIDTCFATLFLRQANLAKDLTSKIQLLGK